MIHSSGLLVTGTQAAIAANEAALAAATAQYQTDLTNNAAQATLDADLAAIEALSATAATLTDALTDATSAQPHRDFYMRSDGTSGGTGAKDDPVQTPAQLMALLTTPGDRGWVLPHATPGASYTFSAALTKLFQPAYSGLPLRPIEIRGVADVNGNYPTFDGTLSVLGSSGDWTEETITYTADATNGITVSTGAKTITRANGTTNKRFTTGLGFAVGQTIKLANTGTATDGQTLTITAVTTTVITVAETPNAAVAVADTDATIISGPGNSTHSNKWTRSGITIYGTSCFFMNGSATNSKSTIVGVSAALQWALVSTSLTVWATSNPASGGLTALTQCTGANAVYGAVNYVTVRDLNFKYFAGRTLSIVAGTKGWWAENVNVTFGSINGFDFSGTDHIITSCTAGHIGSVTGAGEHGFCIRPPYDNIIVSRCKAWDTGEDGIQFTSIDNTNRDGTVYVRYCDFWDNAENAFDFKRGSYALIENCTGDAGGGRSGGDSTEVVTMHSGFTYAEFRDCTFYQRSGASTCFHVAPFDTGHGQILADRCMFVNTGGGGIFINNENGGIAGDCVFNACISIVNNSGGGGVKDSSGSTSHGYKRRYLQGTIVNVATAGTGLLLALVSSAACIWEILEDSVIESGGAPISVPSGCSISGTAHANSLRRSQATDILVVMNGTNYTAAQASGAGSTLATAFSNLGGANFLAQSAGTSFLNVFTCSSLTRSGTTCTAIFTAATDLKVGSSVWIRGAIAAEDDYNGVWKILSVSTTTLSNDTITFKIQDDAAPTTPATTPGGITCQSGRLANAAASIAKTKGGNQSIKRDIRMLPYVNSGASDPQGAHSTVSSV
jgi:hypothetical protein